MALLEEGDSVEIEFLGIHTFFTHRVMFPTPSFAVYAMSLESRVLSTFFFHPFFSFLSGGMGVGALTKASASSLQLQLKFPNRRVKPQAGEMASGSSGLCSF